jgi:proteasome assembly chaperone (PAC2) family protein
MTTPAPSQLLTLHTQRLHDATLLLALTGWMDGGQVSTGTVNQLMSGRDAKPIARIEPDDFYIYNFPGSMEVASLFRPHVTYDAGVVTNFDLPTNTFLADESSNLLFFIGKEPNLKWQTFADCIFHIAQSAGVSRIIFMGSFGGSVPHTREPRLFGSVSSPKLKSLLKDFSLRPSDYQGPGSFATMLLAEARRHDLEMLSIVAEIPSYLQGLNPLSIEAVSRRLAKILNLSINLDALRETSNEWESQVSAAVEKDLELAETIRKLEEQYDNELIRAES